MGASRFDIVVLGLSITSSWGNGHATTYRALVRELCARGHQVLFLERDVPWYAETRDLPAPPYGQLELYQSLDELRDRFSGQIRAADVVIVGSFVPEGVAVGRWVTSSARAAAFYDIDTPVTLAKLRRGECDYLALDLISQYQLYLSLTGGPTLSLLERQYGAPCARPFYCSVDPSLYYPEEREQEFDLGYMGTYSDDRQPGLDRLLLEPARRWVQGRYIVAGPLYPENLEWPQNVTRVQHLPPCEHRAFYNRQRFTLNVTREDMVAAGYSPSVRLFEAAACATPIVTDAWPGLDSFFRLGEEVLISSGPEETLRYLRETTEDQRRQIGARARNRILSEHTASRRAEELEEFVLALKPKHRTLRFPSTLESQLREPRSKAEERVAELGPWFHNLHLPGGTQTAPDHPLGDFPACLWESIGPHLPEDLYGWTVLDIGCNAGFYSFELARRGATVTGIDCEPRYLRQAEWGRQVLGFEDRVSFRQLQAYELARQPESYDLVLFMGVFYHLRHPLLILDLLSEKTRKLMIFQSLLVPGEEVFTPDADFSIHRRDLMRESGWPRMAFIEHSLAGDSTNWWAPNRAGVEAMLRSSGFRVVERMDTEIYLCAPEAGGPREDVLTELRAATGQAFTGPEQG
jgi:methyltransferase (TIGR04290 family)